MTFFVMAVPTIDIYKIALGKIFRRAYVLTFSRISILLLFSSALSGIFVYVFRLFLQLHNIPLIDIGTLQGMFSDFLENDLARTVAYMFALDQIQPFADFLINFGFVFFASLPPVFVGVTVVYSAIIVRRALRGDRKDLTD